MRSADAGWFSSGFKSNGVFMKDLLLIVKEFFPQRDNLTALAEGGPNDPKRPP